VMWSLWRQWGEPVGAAFGQPELRYEYAPVVWHRADGQLFENDAMLTSWGRRPLVFVLDVRALSVRPVHQGEEEPYSPKDSALAPLWFRGAPDRRTDAQREADRIEAERMVARMRDGRSRTRTAVILVEAAPIDAPADTSTASGDVAEQPATAVIRRVRSRAKKKRSGKAPRRG
jgi:hypothetical protein